MQDQTQVKSLDQVLADGEGVVFKGTPNTGVIAGPEYSPQLPTATKQGGV